MSDAPPRWPEMVPILLTLTGVFVGLVSGIVIGAWWPW